MDLVRPTEISLKSFRAVESGEKTAADVLPKAEAKVGAAPPEADIKVADTPKAEAKTDDETEADVIETSEAGKQLAKKRGSLHERIGSLTAQLANKDQHIATLHAKFGELDALKAELAAMKAPKKDEPAGSEDDEPTEEQFEQYRDYVKAQARWEARQELQAALEARDRRDTERRSQQDFVTAVSAHAKRVVAAQATHDDYDAIVAQGNAQLAQAGVRLPPAMMKAIVESDHSADLLYDLASHPEVCIQHAREAEGLPLTAAVVVRRVLESRLTPAVSGPDAKPSPITKAAPPIKPVGGSATAAQSVESMIKGTEISLKKFREATQR